MYVRIKKVKYCTLNYETKTDRLCISHQLFDEKTIKSSKLEFVNTQNFNPSLTLIFLKPGKPNLIYKFSIKTLHEDNIEWDFRYFVFSSFFDLKPERKIKSFGFIDPDSGVSINMLALYDFENAYIIRISNQSIYEPIQCSLKGKDLFINDQYIMLLEYDALEIQYINFRYGFTLKRKIWTEIPIISLKSVSDVNIIHDFLLVRQKSEPSIILTLKISDLNPHITKGNDVLTVKDTVPIKYMMTDQFSIASLGIGNTQSFEAILSTRILKYQLSPDRKSVV